MSTEKAASHLGELHYDFTISAGAKPAFDEGLLLLHSFEYEDARVAFMRATEADPSELMAWWGVAMTHYKALWGLQDLDAGRGVLQQVGNTQAARLAKAENELERDFWEAVEILYGEGEFSERNKAYAEHMGGLYKKHAGNQEVAAFYSLGLMWSIPVGRDEEVVRRSATVAAGVLEENPNHPGALHYMIHAYDDPQLASLAVEAADLYAGVAPDAAHALHMPSHIYLQLGRWNDVVSSNESSYGASVRRMERMGLGDASRGFHSYRWLHYGYLQQGRYEEAEKMVIDMQSYTEKANTRGARGYLIEMQAAQLIETGGWSLDVVPVEVEEEKLALLSFGEQAFFKSMMAFHANDAITIEKQIAALSEKLVAAELLVTDAGIAMCSAGPTRTAPNKNTLLGAQVRIEQMNALVRLLAEDVQGAESHLVKATQLESRMPYSSGPARIAYPSHEQYGDWLLSQARYAEALEQFNTSLERAPNRTKALRGKIAAASKLGMQEDVESAQELLNEFWQQPKAVASL